MNRLTTYLKFAMVALIATVGMVACEEEPEAPKAPLAFFSSEADADNSQLIHFTNETENGITYSWDFGDPDSGDNNTSTDVSPSHEFSDGGEFTVTLTATNEGGDNVYSEKIQVTKAAAVNLIENGSFDDETGWTMLYFWYNANGDATITDGAMMFTEVGPWNHHAYYQELTLEPGTYNLDMHVEFTDIFEIWGEAFVGKTVPVGTDNATDADYSDNMVIQFLNGWACDLTYSGTAVELACEADTKGNGEFTITEAGTYYLVIKSGGNTRGANGIKIDDVTLFKQ